jgi:hypothetical protein
MWGSEGAEEAGVLGGQAPRVVLGLGCQKQRPAGWLIAAEGTVNRQGPG